MLPPISLGVKTTAEAAVLADEYVLLHRNNYSGQNTEEKFSCVRVGSEFHDHRLDKVKKQDNTRCT